jgi:PAS domain S-box-containing protein
MPADVQAVFPEEFQAALPELMDALEAGVIVVDAAMRIRGWNRWMEGASGKSRAAVIGASLDAVFPNVKPVVVDAFRSALEGRPMMLSQSLHRCPLELPARGGFDGFDQMQQTVRLVPIESSDGAERAVLVFVQDVTDRVASERELRSATERAEAANRSKSEFLATMSHELRTPIGAMTGYADLILEGIYGPVTPEQRTHLERVKAVGRHLLNIVEEILLFARVEAGREELHLGTVDVFQIARDSLAVVDPMAREKGLRVLADVPATKASATTDEVKVRQILINLLGNAVKFTRQGEIGLAARVDDAKGLVVFTIRDTGEGIAPGNLERIFEPFTQIANAYSRTQPGTGLGLPVSRRLARMLGGDLTAQSELGRGSVFTASILRSGPEPV